MLSCGMTEGLRHPRVLRWHADPRSSIHAESPDPSILTLYHACPAISHLHLPLMPFAICEISPQASTLDLLEHACISRPLYLFLWFLKRFVARNLTAKWQCCQLRKLYGYGTDYGYPLCLSSFGIPSLLFSCQVFIRMHVLSGKSRL